MAKNALAFDVDAREGTAALGFVNQMATSIRTERHMAPVVEMSHGFMSDAFTADMAFIATTDPESFHHVYEWGEIGVPQSRLWQDVLRGRGSNRIATFEWRASKQVVPVPDIEGDPGKGVIQEVHVFVWKAPVMEYDMSVLVRPKSGKYLVFPTGDPNDPLFFSSKSINFRPGRQQMASGESRLARHGMIAGNGTAGKFTAAYVGWWGGPGSDAAFDRTARHVIEQDLNRLPMEQATKPFRRTATKSFKLTRATNNQAAYDFGKAEAEKWLIDRDQKYYQMAKRRRSNV